MRLLRPKLHRKDVAIVEPHPAEVIERGEDCGTRQRRDPEDRRQVARPEPGVSGKNARFRVLVVVRIEALHGVGALGVAVRGAADPAAIALGLDPGPGREARGFEGEDTGQRHDQLR